jgi:hypothetical protein
VDALYGHLVSPFDLKRALGLVIHCLLWSRNDDLVCQAYFTLLSDILQKSRVTLSHGDSAGIREYVFLQTTLMDNFGVWDGYSEAVFEGSYNSHWVTCPIDDSLRFH